MCAAKSGTPSLISAGAAITAQMMYEAVTGTARPTIQTTSEVKIAVSSSEPRGVVDDDRAELEAEAGERDDADDDAGAGAGRADVEHADRAAFHRLGEARVEHVLLGRAAAAEEVVRKSAVSGRSMLVASATTVAQNTDSTGENPQQHEGDDRDQREEVEPVALAQVPDRVDALEGDVAHAELAGVDLDHQEQRQVEQQRRDARHQQHVEVRDLQELGDQERRGAEHRRRDDRAEPARGEQAAGGVLLVADLLEHRDRRPRRASPSSPRPSPTARRAGTKRARRCARRRWACRPSPRTRSRGRTCRRPRTAGTRRRS